MRVDETSAGKTVARALDPSPGLMREGQLRLRIAVCCWTVVVVATAFAFTIPRFHVPRIDAGFNPSSLEVGVGHELIQTFVVFAQGLDEITLEVVDASPDTTVAFDVGVWQGALVTVLYRQTVSLGAGGRSVSLRFAPLPTDRDLVYVLRARPQASDASAHVTLKSTEGHVYPEGAVWLDGVEQSLDLVMHADAVTAQPWRALAVMLRARTGVPGIEWVLSGMYLAALFGTLRGLAEV